MEKLRQFYRDAAGNATEYVLIVTIVSLAIFVGAQLLGFSLAGLFDRVNGAFPR